MKGGCLTRKSPRNNIKAGFELFCLFNIIYHYVCQEKNEVLIINILYETIRAI